MVSMWEILGPKRRKYLVTLPQERNALDEETMEMIYDVFRRQEKEGEIVGIFYLGDLDIPVLSYV